MFLERFLEARNSKLCSDSKIFQMFQVEEQRQKALHHNTPFESLGSLLTLTQHCGNKSFQYL